MNTLFDAIEARFNANASLVAKGRKLYQGYDGVPRQSGPHTEVTLELAYTLDTFNSDIEVYNANFTYFSGKIQSADAATWLEEMIESFETGTLAGTGFSVASMKLVGQREPFVVDDMYRASCAYEIVIQRSSLLPATRGV